MEDSDNNSNSILVPWHQRCRGTDDDTDGVRKIEPVGLQMTFK